MARKTKTKESVPQLGYEEDPGLPGGGQGRVDVTGTSGWTPPEGEFPPGEAYQESGMSGVLRPEQFAEKTATRSRVPCVSIDIVPDNHHWVIVKGFHRLKEHESTCFDSPSPGLPLWEGCWTGRQWAPTTERAQRFDERREAEAYLTEHRKQIEASLVSITKE